MNKNRNRLAGVVAAALVWPLAFTVSASEPAPEKSAPADTAARAGAEERMGQAYLLIGQAAQAYEDGDAARARETYENALGLLEGIENDYPGWFTQVVRHRILHCESAIEQIQTGKKLPDPLVEKSPVPPAATQSEQEFDFPVSAAVAATSMRALKAGIAERDARVEELRDEIRELKAKNRELAENQTGHPDDGEAPALYPAVLKAEARRLIETGAASNAVALLMETRRLLPQDVTVAHLLAIAFCREGKYEAAIRLAEPLTKHKGRSSGEVWLTIGVAQLGLGNLGRSRVAFENALDRDPALAEAHFNLAQILVRLEKPDGEAARDHYERAIQAGAARDPVLELAIRQALLLDRVKYLK